MSARRAKPSRCPEPPCASGAFTLIELLVVAAVLGILAAILIPAVSSARGSANKARTRVQFAQWTAALELFRSEYGHYPDFGGAPLVNAGANGTDHAFHDVLAGRRRDGSPLTGGSPAAAQNPKRIAFYTFPQAELVADGAGAGLLCDGFGGTEIAVLIDRNLDGVVDPADFGALPAVAGMSPVEEFPATGVRASVVFYSPLPGATADNPGFVFSWK